MLNGGNQKDDKEKCREATRHSLVLNDQNIVFLQGEVSCLKNDVRKLEGQLEII